MGCARALDRLAVWLNFFDIKTRHYALMSYSTKQFGLNQLFLWKFFCGSIMYVNLVRQYFCSIWC
jgi:hypothetical protein